MSQIKEVISLVKETLESGLAKSEYVPVDKGQGPFVRYLVGRDMPDTNVVYIGKVKGTEPAEVSIARRMMSGNLNLQYVVQQEECSKEMLDVLNKIKVLTEEANLPMNHKDLEAAFDQEIKSLYTKEITIYHHDIVLDLEQLLSARFFGELPKENLPRLALLSVSEKPVDAISQLDGMGVYKAIAKITVPDQFDTVKNLESVIKACNASPPLLSLPNVEQISPVSESNYYSIGSGAVLKIDNKSYTYTTSHEGFVEIEGFKGLEKQARKISHDNSLGL
ncbi:hypothetical protein ACI2KR_30540 [Pseudomonas luteola]